MVYTARDMFTDQTKFFSCAGGTTTDATVDSGALPSNNVGGVIGGVVCVLIILILISVALIVFAIIALRYKRSQRKGNLCEQARVYITEKGNSQRK